MSEKAIVESIKKYLKGIGAKVIKIHGGLGMAGTPDLIGCYQGKGFALEAKTDKGKVTPLQERELKAWAASGAITGVVRSVDDVRELLN